MAAARARRPPSTSCRWWSRPPRRGRGCSRLPPRRGAGGPARAPRARVVRRPRPALARRAGDQQQARWRSAASPTRPRRSTAGTWAPRSGPATSPTATATTWSRRSPSGWGSTPLGEATLWRDRALVEINRAVLHSFDARGVTITDHHTESRPVPHPPGQGGAGGRRCPADWSWIVPPMSGSQTPVFHRYYDDPDPADPPGLPPAPTRPRRAPATVSPASRHGESRVPAR